MEPITIAALCIMASVFITVYGVDCICSNWNKIKNKGEPYVSKFCRTIQQFAFDLYISYLFRFKHSADSYYVQIRTAKFGKYIANGIRR